MLFGQKKIIGLDIGTTSIKLAELDVSRRGATLQSFVMTPTPSQGVVGGDIVDPNSVGQAVAQLVREAKSKRKSAAIGLSGSSVIVKKISVPAMDKELLGEQIRWEAEQYIPYDISEVNIAYEILKGSGGETMDIILVAAKQDAIFKISEALGPSNLSCDVVDVSGFALANCFERNYGAIQGQSVCLLNIGAAITNFVIVESGEVVFCRDIPVGGASYTSEIQKGMSISAEEAESMKISSSMGQPVPEEVTSLINQSHEAICEEISNSIDFYVSTSQGSPVAQCFITGGSSKITGLQSFMSRAVKVPCEVFNPLSGVRYNEKAFSPEYISEIREFAAVAIGLGLRKAGDA